ncbi:MAG: ABC transporter permease subunit [Melioribacteraceae bacterium]
MLTLLFVYILLFEFILPVNKVLPKPSLLIESFSSIWLDYNLLTSMALTTTAVYLSLILSFAVIFFLSKQFIYYIISFKDIYDSIEFYKYIPSLFAVIIFVYWFNDSILAEFIFGFVFASALLKISLFDELKNIKEEYYIAARNMGLNEKEIFKKVIFRSLEPALFKKLIKIHYSLWMIILIYEYIDGNGFGGAYKKILLYGDFAGIFVLTIIISLLIWIGSLLLKFIQAKYFFWES